MSSTLVSRANRYMLRSTPDLNTLSARPPTVSYIPTHHCQLAPTFGVANGRTPGMGGRLPTLWLIARKSAIMAAWLVVML